MSTQQFETPILLLVFNRPETTRPVFDAIRSVKPAKLYIVADGPRPDVAEDLARCSSVREIVSAVDWECKVTTNFRAINMGCGRGVVNGVSWFFEHESEGIILEDDCIAGPSFFRFCGDMLKKFRYDSRVMSIGGNNFEKLDTREHEYSYTFSNHIYVWGWATWRRAWKLNDYHLKHLPEVKKKNYLTDHYSSIYERDLFEYIFDRISNDDERLNKSKIWDYQWQFTCKINSGLTIVPNRNLVVNIGFGEGATNTGHVRDSDYNLKLEKMEFPLRHPDFMMVNAKREKRTFNSMHTSWNSRARSVVKAMLPRPVVEKLVKPFLHLLLSNGKKPVYVKEDKVKAYV